jgi:hypothetical protein
MRSGIPESQKPLVGLINWSLRLTYTHHHDLDSRHRPFNQRHIILHALTPAPFSSSRSRRHPFVLWLFVFLAFFTFHSSHTLVSTIVFLTFFSLRCLYVPPPLTLVPDRLSTDTTSSRSNDFLRSIQIRISPHPDRLYLESLATRNSITWANT